MKNPRKKGEERTTKNLRTCFWYVNTIYGIKENIYHWLKANKCMQLSAIAYNLKKYLKFIEKRTKSGAGIPGLNFRLKATLKEAVKSILTDLNLKILSTV